MLNHAAMNRPIISSNSRRKPSLGTSSFQTIIDQDIQLALTFHDDDSDNHNNQDGSDAKGQGISNPAIEKVQSTAKHDTKAVEMISKMTSKNSIKMNENSNPNKISQTASNSNISKTSSRSMFKLIEKVNSHQSTSSTTSNNNGLNKIRKIDSNSVIGKKNTFVENPIPTQSLANINEDSFNPSPAVIVKQESVTASEAIDTASSRPKSRRRLSYGGGLEFHPDKDADMLVIRLAEREKEIEELKKEIEMLKRGEPAVVVVNKQVNTLLLEKQGKIKSDKYGPLPCATHGHVCETCCQVVVAPKWARVLGIPQTSLEAEAEKKRAKKICKKMKWGKKIYEFMKKKIKTVHEVEKEIDEVVNQTIIDNGLDDKRKSVDRKSWIAKRSNLPLFVESDD